MLETDEVDIDYFTPAGTTSLASIFGKNSVLDESKESPSLKYVPPPPPDKSKSEEVKSKQWIFTCAIHGFEWINSEYISRGKLGLAVLKVVQTNSHSIILYDSNKRTVSYVTVSPKLSIHIRDDSTISYYDNAQKYWIIKTSDDDMHKMLELLNNLEAAIVPKCVQERVSEETDNTKLLSSNDVIVETTKQGEEQDTDTDTYNHKTKNSILRRMANMGHSVLPPHGSLQGRMSDSSQSDECDSKANIKHRTCKITPKRSTDLSLQESEYNIASRTRMAKQDIHIDTQTFVPSKNVSTSSYGSDMNVFISEQKISNSELRINVNRVSDKLDVVLERLNDVSNIDKNSYSNFQNDIVQKLIKEYESKIKYYEYIMNSKGIDFHSQSRLIDNVSNNCEDNVTNMNKIAKLEKECREKDNILKEMEQEIKYGKEKNIKLIEDNQKNVDDLMLKIENLNKNLSVKNNEIESFKNNSNTVGVNIHESTDITSKLKKIMNDTFEAISVNFDDEEDYSGEKIKAIIAIMIKKTTIQALQEL